MLRISHLLTLAAIAGLLVGVMYISGSQSPAENAARARIKTLKKLRLKQRPPDKTSTHSPTMSTTGTILAGKTRTPRSSFLTDSAPTQANLSPAEFTPRK